MTKESRSSEHRRAQEKKRADIGECELCGSTDNLNSHHIWAYAKGGDELPPYEILMVLCKGCHDDIHRDERITVYQNQNGIRVFSRGGR